MKNKLSLLTLAATLILTTGCATTGTTASSGDDGDSTSNSGNKGNSSSGSTSGGSSTTTDTKGESTSILPSSASSYEDGGYSFEYHETYADFMDDKDLSLLEEETLPETYTEITGKVDITEAGSYYINAQTLSKKITLNLSEAGDVHIFMNASTLTNDKAVISSEDTDATTNLIITLIGDNSITSTGKNAINVNSNIIINGTGSASITSGVKNCLKAAGYIYIEGVALNLAANDEDGAYEGHGISALSVYAKDSTINISAAGKDGIHAELDDVALTKYVNSEGYVFLDGVAYTYSGKGDGIQADSFVYATDTNLNIENEAYFVAYGSDEATAEGITDSDEFKFKKSGSNYYKVDSEQRGKSGTYAIVNSTKGIKVGTIDQEDSDGNETEIESIYYAMELENTTLVYDGAEDGVKTKLGYTIVRNSEFTIDTLDQGFDGDGPLMIYDTKIGINSCYEGLQASSIHVNGEDTDINIVASDDAINATTDYIDDNYNFYRMTMYFNNGNVEVHSGGDGLDSNGSIYFNGSNVVAEGSQSGGDSPIDTAESNENSRDHGYYMLHGSVIATGASGMLESPQTTSDMYSIVYTYSSSFVSGNVVDVRDASGNVLVSSTLTKSAQALIASSYQFTSGSTYYIYKDGTKIDSLTLTSKVTSNGSSGQGGQQGGGGQWGPGGGQGGPGGGR